MKPETYIPASNHGVNPGALQREQNRHAKRSRVQKHGNKKDFDHISPGRINLVKHADLSNF